MPTRFFLTVVCLFAALTPCLAVEKPTITVPMNRSGDYFQVWMQSSLQRVYPNSPVGESATITRTAYRNGRFSFQIVVRNTSLHHYNVRSRVKDATDLNVTVRRVGYVPVRWLTTETPLDDLEGVGFVPGLVPDPLFPTNYGSMGPEENLAFWVTVFVPENVEAGKRTITLTVEFIGNTTVDLEATMDVRDFTLQKRRDFPVTHWWLPSDIAKLHNVELWTDEWFDITRAYIQNMIDNGTPYRGDIARSWYIRRRPTSNTKNLFVKHLRSLAEGIFS